MSDEPDSITGAAKITVTCATCRKDVDYLMSPDEARSTAAGLLAVADGIPLIRIEVKSHG